MTILALPCLDTMPCRDLTRRLALPCPFWVPCIALYCVVTLPFPAPPVNLALPGRIALTCLGALLDGLLRRLALP